MKFVPPIVFRRKRARRMPYEEFRDTGRRPIVQIAEKQIGEHDDAITGNNSDWWTSNLILAKRETKDCGREKLTARELGLFAAKQEISTERYRGEG